VSILVKVNSRKPPYTSFRTPSHDVVVHQRRNLSSRVESKECCAVMFTGDQIDDNGIELDA